MISVSDRERTKGTKPFARVGWLHLVGRVSCHDPLGEGKKLRGQRDVGGVEEKLVVVDVGFPPPIRDSSPSMTRS